MRPVREGTPDRAAGLFERSTDLALFSLRAAIELKADGSRTREVLRPTLDKLDGFTEFWKFRSFGWFDGFSRLWRFERFYWRS